MTDPLCEVCIESLDGALAARDGGGDRIELCQALALGGLTPSAGLVDAVRAAVDLPVFAMVRPRAGDFVVDDSELRVVLREVRRLRAQGVDGLVFGAVTPTGRIDAAVLERVVAAAGPLPVTFHRAFDLLEDPLTALDELVRLGVRRVLTSGGAASAWDGRARIAELVGRAPAGLTILAGAGVGPDNVAELIRATGVAEVHFSASRQEPPRMRVASPLWNDSRHVTCVERVAETVRAARS